MNDLVPLKDLVAALASATENGKSGAFFVTTEHQHSAMITLARGRITGMKYRQARGYDAAAALAGMAQLKYKTASEPTELPGEGDLNTRAILEILASGGAEPVAVPESAARAAVDLDELRDRYVAAIGPIGGALFDEVVNELGDKVTAPEGVRLLIERLAEHIDEEDEATRFRQDTRVNG